MAKATIAVAVLALTLLLTGPVAAAENRKLLTAVGQAASTSGTYGPSIYSKSGSADESAAFSNPYASASAAGGASYAVNVGPDGKPSISTSFGEGTSLSAFGQSQSQAQAAASGNKVPGTYAGTAINVGSSNGGAASDAAAAAFRSSGK